MTASPTTSQTIKVERLVNAPIEKVYQAFADEKMIGKWLGCGHVNFSTIESDLKIGGHRNLMGTFPDTGEPMRITGEYVEIIPNQRLKFTWNTPDSEDPVVNSMVTIDLKKIENKTQIMITHEDLLTELAINNHQEGWVASLEALDELVSSQQSDKLEITGVIPHIVYQNAAEAIDFYVKAFGAKELYRIPTDDNQILHAHLLLNNGNFFLCDQFCSQKTGAEGLTLHLEVKDVDSAFQKAVDAGATVVMPVSDMFWGARYGQVSDPFGITWSIATQTQQLSQEEILKASKTACGPE